MNAIRICLGALVLAALLVAMQSGLRAAQTEDVFAFIPDGGRTLLVKIMHTRPPAEEARALLTSKRTREEWVKYLQGHVTAVPALKALDKKAVETLADYLSFHMPLPAKTIPADLAKADWAKVLPKDGRDLTMENCQFCHIITVVVTQARTKTAWLGTMHKPSHIEIELTEPQREALASYLVINAGIPADLVPEELRAGGASY